jgi:hypothetical protein
MEKKIDHNVQTLIFKKIKKTNKKQKKNLKRKIKINKIRRE